MSIPFGWLFRSRWARLVLLVLLLYTAVYIVLSVCGAYRDNVGSLARLGIITRGMSDRQEWQAAFVIVTHFPEPDPGLRANVAGWVFLPLALLDQRLCHKTQPMAWYESAADKYTRTGDYVAVCLLVGFGLWWLLFPGQVIGVYCWFSGSELKRPALFGMRLAGALWIVLVSGLLLTVFLKK